MYRVIFTVCFLFSLVQSQAQINTKNIEIIRDEYGVPHIFAETDAEAAYGLAWAHCEDDFYSIQENLLSAKALLAASRGKNDALFDFLVKFTDIEKVVNEKYESSLSEDYKKIISAYTQGVNDYAKKFPKEVWYKKAFPVTEKDVIKGYTLAMTLFSGVSVSIARVVRGFYDNMDVNLPGGSNALVVSARYSEDGNTYLVINPHNDFQGRYTWYEASINSKQGYKMHGALFPGGVHIFVGHNDKLAWTHTFNYNDLVDVYQLEMHPKKKLWYKVDGEYLKMVLKKHKIKVKVNSWLRVPVSRKSYETIFGNALKSKDGKFYAIKMNANEEIRSGEQWYRMGLAQNFDEFQQALKMDAFALLNVFYADVDDNIYFLSQGHYPVRNPNFKYEDLVPGNTKATLWQGMIEFENRPSLLNPECGFIYNANNTPLRATCDNDNIEEVIKNKIIGLQYNETNRGQRFKEIFDTLSSFNYQILKNIKYDLKYPENGLLAQGIERLKQLDTGEDSLTTKALQLLSDWDKNSDYENRGASFSLVFFKFFFGLIDGGVETFFIRNKNPEFDVIKKTAHATFGHFDKFFSGEIVPLKEIQRHRRGDKDLPVRGSLDVLAALDSRLQNDGRFVARSGDSFIGFVTLNKNGITSETVVPYGASDREDSPHYYDQMEMYLDQKTKKVIIDRETLLKKPHKIYHPGNSNQ